MVIRSSVVRDQVIGTSTILIEGLNVTGGVNSNGGAILALDNPNVTIRNCAFFGNRANINGGVISGGLNLTIENSTLANNTAGSLGTGAMRIDGQLTILNTTIAGNEADGSAGIFFSGSGAVVVSDSIVPGFTDFSSGNNRNITSGDPLLAPLANYGGTTMSMRPLPSSPAIDAGSGSVVGTDQRGLPRLSGPALDLGAVELQEIVVNTLFDENDGIGVSAISLRDAVNHNVPGEAEVIRFFQNITGLVRPLSAGSPITITRDVLIDASNLPLRAGYSGNINGSVSTNPGDINIFVVSGDHHVTMNYLRLEGGYADPTTAFPENSGGAIRNLGGTVILNNCLLEGHSATNFGGGAILNHRGDLTLNDCTVSDCSAKFGGAIYEFRGQTTLNRSTVFGCTASQRGGGLYCDSGNLIVNNSTISGNHAFSRGGGLSVQNTTATGLLRHATIAHNTSSIATGGIYSGVSLTLEDSIIANNTGGTEVDLNHVGSDVILNGTSLVGVGTPSLTTTGTGTILTGLAALSPLGDFGGLTQTILLLPGSQAIDAGGVESTTDQRGFSRVGNADLGATEFQGGSDITLLSAATFDDTTVRQLFSTDLDGDGRVFGLEHVFGSNPYVADAGTPIGLENDNIVGAGNEVTLQFDTMDEFAGSVLTLSRSTNLLSGEMTELMSFNSSLDTFRRKGVSVFRTLAGDRRTWMIEDQNPPPVQAYYSLSLSDVSQLLIYPEMVEVGNFGNSADPQANSQGDNLGAVAYPFTIGKFEVTYGEYGIFLNAVDPDGLNELSLYNSEMMDPGSFGGINLVPGNANGSKYDVKSDFENKPVVLVSVYDAMRYCNWLHNGGQRGADTESGAYTLLGNTPVPSNAATITRNAGARYALPTHDEWYKAAYHQPSSNGGDMDDYWLYPIRGNFPPSGENPPGSGIAAANFIDEDGGNARVLTDVGAYAGSPNFYGLFDVAGNVFELTETRTSAGFYVRKGGAFDSVTSVLQSSSLRDHGDTTEEISTGFRIVSP